jgi:RadC-like JAB domain
MPPDAPAPPAPYYEGAVRATLSHLGSPDPDGDLAHTGDFWKKCQTVGITPENCAAVIYSTAKHKHGGTTSLREGGGASEAPKAESPTREEWEVVVRRTGNMEKIKHAAKVGGRPMNIDTDQVVGNHVIFGDFYDDEKAWTFARHMTNAGFIASYGPRRAVAAAEEGRAKRSNPRERLIEDAYASLKAESGRRNISVLKVIQRSGLSKSMVHAYLMGQIAAGAANPTGGDVSYASPEEIDAALMVEGEPHLFIELFPDSTSAAEDKGALRWTEVWFQFPADASKFAGLLEKQHSTVVASATNRIVRTNATAGDISKVLKKHRWQGRHILDAESIAAELAPVISEAREAPMSPRRGQILNAAQKAERFGDNKAYIASVWDAMRANGSKQSLESFKVELLEMQQRGDLELSRADLRGGAQSEALLDRSEIIRKDQWGQAEYHFIVLPTGFQEARGGHIPWVKVERDPKAHESAMKLAEKHGPISNPTKVYELVGADLAKEDSEIFLVIPLNLRGELKAPPYEIARGQRSHVAVGVNDVMRAVLDSGCEGFIVCHSHPSGTCSPSKADRDLTDQIKKATMPFGREVKYIDHVVIGTRQYYSIEEGKTYKI